MIFTWIQIKSICNDIIQKKKEKGQQSLSSSRSFAACESGTAWKGSKYCRFPTQKTLGLGEVSQLERYSFSDCTADFSLFFLFWIKLNLANPSVAVESKWIPWFSASDLRLLSCRICIQRGLQKGHKNHLFVFKKSSPNLVVKKTSLFKCFFLGRYTRKRLSTLLQHNSFSCQIHIMIFHYVMCFSWIQHPGFRHSVEYHDFFGGGDLPGFSSEPNRLT